MLVFTTMKFPEVPTTMDPKAFRCCLCCHVRTGTLIYGILTLLLQVFIFGLLVLAGLRPDVLKPQNQQPYDGIIVVETKEGSFVEEIDGAPGDEYITKDNLCIMFVFSMVQIMSVIALIYGTTMNRASYLMPCFCLQVFDFCLNCLTVVGSFTYASNIKMWIRDQHMENYPAVQNLMCLDSDYLMLAFVTGFILVLSIKAYLIGMVWSCYKFIKLHVISRSMVREYSVDPDTEMLLPPRYEDAIKVSSNYPEPPAYSAQ